MRRGTVSIELGVARLFVVFVVFVTLAFSFSFAVARGRTHLAAPGLRYLFARDANLLPFFHFIFFIFVVLAGIYSLLGYDPRSDTCHLLLKVKHLRVNLRSERARQIMQKPP